MDEDMKKIVGMACLTAIALAAMVVAQCDFNIVAGAGGAVAVLAGAAWGARSQ